MCNFFLSCVCAPWIWSLGPLLPPSVSSRRHVPPVIGPVPPRPSLCRPGWAGPSGRSVTCLLRFCGRLLRHASLHFSRRKNKTSHDHYLSVAIWGIISESVTEPFGCFVVAGDEGNAEKSAVGAASVLFAYHACEWRSSASCQSICPVAPLLK